MAWKLSLEFLGIGVKPSKERGWRQAILLLLSFIFNSLTSIIQGVVETLLVVSEPG